MGEAFDAADSEIMNSLIDAVGKDMSGEGFGALVESLDSGGYDAVYDEKTREIKVTDGEESYNLNDADERKQFLKKFNEDIQQGDKDLKEMSEKMKKNIDENGGRSSDIPRALDKLNDTVKNLETKLNNLGRDEFWKGVKDIGLFMLKAGLASTAIFTFFDSLAKSRSGCYLVDSQGNNVFRIHDKATHTPCDCSGDDAYSACCRSCVSDKDKKKAMICGDSAGIGKCKQKPVPKDTFCCAKSKVCCEGRYQLVVREYTALDMLGHYTGLMGKIVDEFGNVVFAGGKFVANLLAFLKKWGVWIVIGVVLLAVGIPLMKFFIEQFAGHKARAAAGGGGGKG